MDVATVLEHALLSGTAAAVSAQATEATKGAFSALTSFLKRIFAANPVGKSAVEKFPEAPEAWTPVLKGQLDQLTGDQLNELVTLARAVLEQTDPAGWAAGRYLVNQSGAKGVQNNYGGSGHFLINDFRRS